MLDIVNVKFTPLIKTKHCKIKYWRLSSTDLFTAQISCVASSLVQAAADIGAYHFESRALQMVTQRTVRCVVGVSQVSTERSRGENM